MTEKREAYLALFAELTNMEAYGICIRLEENLASPLQIISAHMIKEENCSYMRDYIFDELGQVEEVCFHNVSAEEKK